MEGKQIFTRIFVYIRVQGPGFRKNLMTNFGICDDKFVMTKL